MNDNNKELGLYIHIPFCNKICSYCDFIKSVSSIDKKTEYIDNLLLEISRIKDFKYKTIYIGGGTPSSLDLSLLEKLLSYLYKNIVLNNTILEYTIECNPEDLNKEFIDLIKKYSINRVSIGIQSFNLDVLKIINRTNNYDVLKNNISYLNKVGINNYNFDYMFGILSLSKKEIKEDLDKIISLSPTHISCYTLILEESTKLYHDYELGNYNPVDDDKEADDYYYIQDYLNSNGYSQYEISNFSKKGYESIHNLIYWNNEEYIGVGQGAASYYSNKRFKNPILRTRYYEMLINTNSISLNNVLFNEYFYEYEELNKIDEMEYQVMLNLRLTKGIDITEFNNKYNCNIFKLYPNINELLKLGYLENKNNRLFIKDKYLYVQDYILNDIFNISEEE